MSKQLILGAGGGGGGEIPTDNLTGHWAKADIPAGVNDWPNAGDSAETVDFVASAGTVTGTAGEYYQLNENDGKMVSDTGATFADFCPTGLATMFGVFQDVTAHHDSANPFETDVLFADDIWGGFYVRKPAGNAQLTFYIWDGGVKKVEVDLPSGKFYAVGCWDGADLVLRLNGVEVGSVSAGNKSGGTAPAQTGHAGDFCPDAKIIEIGTYNVYVVGTQITELESYLATL